MSSTVKGNRRTSSSKASRCASEAKYRRLFETMTQGVVYYSADGQIISVNPAAERILGLPFARMQGRRAMDPEWRTVDEDGADLPEAEHPALLALATGRPVLGKVIGVLQAEQGRHCWLLVDAAGKTAAALGGAGSGIWRFAAAVWVAAIENIS